MSIWDWTRRCGGPIGVDMGTTGLRMVQLSQDGSRLVALGRRELPAADDGGKFFSPDRCDAIVSAIGSLRQQFPFRGRRAVVVLNDRQLYIQNIRIPRVSELPLRDLVRQEAAARLPFPIDEAEIRYLNAGEVRQGDRLHRELIVFATPRQVLDDIVMLFDRAGLQVSAMDVEPGALVRAFAHEYRRDEDVATRSLLVHVGSSRTAVLVVDGRQPLLIKYIPVGGCQFDQAVAKHLGIELRAAISLRRHHGDRRADRRDPEVTKTVDESTRPVVEKLISELSMCCRYYSVTFRGAPLTRLVIGGGEASESLAQTIANRLSLPGAASRPFRHVETRSPIEDAAGWDVAVGAALRESFRAVQKPQRQPTGVAS